jgi:uncharacterized protein YegJ (DUF2314 family)
MNPHLTTLESDGWMIDDGEVAHAESPESYWIPSLADRQSLEAGAIAKVRFYIRTTDESGEVVDHGERMWVKVQERHGDWYFGLLDNDPYCTDDIKAGFPLWFQARHVIGVYKE